MLESGVSEIFNSNAIASMLWNFMMTGLFAAGVAVQLLFCLFAKKLGVQLIPAIIANIIVKAFSAVAAGFFIGIFIMPTDDGWAALGMMLIGMYILVIEAFPLSFYIGVGVGWIIYAVLMKKRRKLNNGMYNYR